MAAAEDGKSSRRGILVKLAGYGFTRTTTEGLLAGRGLLLAGILGPEIFGIWALFRILLRYLAFAGLGILRGLELLVSRATAPGGHPPEAVAWGRATAAHTYIIYASFTFLSGVLAAAYSGGASATATATAGVALCLLAERTWAYGVAYLRVAHGLRQFAGLELLHGVLQFGFCVLLCLQWGIYGAFAGFAIAHLSGVSLLARRVPLSPAVDFARVRELVRIGFPVSLLGILAAVLATADKLLVGAFLGLEALGLYAFAIAISELGLALAGVVRTVILKDIYGGTTSAAPSVGTLRTALAGFSTVGPAVAGALAILLPPLIGMLTGDYDPAYPLMQVLLFAGVLQGTINLAVLQLVAEGRQGVLVGWSLAAVCISIALTLAALAAGLGLQGVAIAALLTRAVYAAAIVTWLGHTGPGFASPLKAFAFLTPTAWCLLTVAVISSYVPADDLSLSWLQLLLYTLAVLALVPAILRLRRDVRPR